MEYWLVGADLGYDNTNDYLENKYWADGYYRSGDNRNEAILKKIKKGDRIAIKSSFTQKNNLPFENNSKFCSVLRIKARGVAQEDFSLTDKKVNVVWEHDFKPIDLYGVSYRKTIAELNNREHIEFIFKDKKQNIDEMKVSDLRNIYEGCNDMLEKAKTLLENKKQIILYGPAGTGKTYNTKNIIENHSNEKYDDLKNSGRVKFVTFHQSFAYEDFIEGIKPNLDSESSEVSYFVESGVFKKMSKLAEANFKKSNKKTSYKKDFEMVFEEQIVEKMQDDKLKIDTQRTYFYITEITERTIFFEKAGGQTNHSLSVASLKRMYDSGSNNIIKGGLSVYYEPILDILLKDSQLDAIEIEPLQNHYLIIDEINRGNISKIFGELITLLEASKRLGEGDELTTTLPYSKEEFGIPPNLYIIGTMNTSDKSIAHLDIALRRRFGFVEMLPSYDEDIIKNEACRTLLKNLNNRIEILLDKDHLIGHSFFCGKSEADIPTIMQNEIVPLLEEYFYGDYEKIQLVLGDKNLVSNKYDKHYKYKDIPSVKKLLDNSNKEFKYEYWFEKEEGIFDPNFGDEKESKAQDD
ncbi:AAA family ATPase [Francisellaceae bacterium CB299]|jgi:5-methylcytosine-specific restriction protein B